LLSADAGSIQAEAGMVPGNAAAVIPGKPRKKLEVHTAHNAVSQQGHTLAFQSECNGVMCLASAPPSSPSILSHVPPVQPAIACACAASVSACPSAPIGKW